jgi:hypothetical protein
MRHDLSSRHELVGNLLTLPKSHEEWQRYKLADEQVAFYHEQGYLAGVRILTDEQIANLRAELAEFFDPQHPGHELWYEYHTNESSKPDTVLFHALGAWRISPGFHDILSAAQCDSGTISSFASRRGTAASSPGTRIILTGPAPSRWRTSPAGSDLTTARAIMDAFITYPAATAGNCCQCPNWPAT